jgi:hypothetical protein
LQPPLALASSSGHLLQPRLDRSNFNCVSVQVRCRCLWSLL